jgi:NAD(P)-dependent dehydrogenase (short-subunit alcohol dehydrogenase family)
LNDLAKQASNLIVIEGDITDIDTLKKAQSEIARRSGGAIDVLINNAAINPGEQMGLCVVFPCR